MTNILIITGWLDVSGTETFIMNVLRNLDKTQFHVDFLLFHEKDTRYSREAESMGCLLYYLPPRNKGLVTYLKSLNSFFKENAERYDVVHYCGGSLTSVAPIYYAKKYGIKLRIAHAHSTSNDGIHNKILHNLNKLIAQSLFTHRWGCSKEACEYFFGSRDTSIIKNGVDVSRFSYNDSARHLIRTQLGIIHDATVIGHIGRFVKLKNQSFIVDVFKAYKELNPNSKLLLVGTGPEERNVRQKVIQMGLEHSVIFTGERQDIPELLWAMDYFVMPSLYEGLPFVLVEAQAAGTFCLVSDTVSRDSKLSEGLSFLGLQETAEKWATTLYNTPRQYNRNDYSLSVTENGYDIALTTKYIEKVYSGETV